MPPPKKWHKKKAPPPGFDYVEPVLEALENELRDVIKLVDPKLRKTQAIWPVHQINWQKSRYIYELYYTFHKIDRNVYQYCLDQKLVDANLIAKWKKPGYERLCSTYVINPTNYKFGTTSICRVPWKDRNSDQKLVKDPTTGCMGCASGGGGPRNIFGNKYGQSLAAVQVAREQRLEAKARVQQQAAAQAKDDDDEAETDDDDAETDDEDDYGPSPAAGIWAGSKQLQAESLKLVDPEGEEATDDDDDTNKQVEVEEEEEPPSKKLKADDA